MVKLAACVLEFLDAHVGELAPTTLTWYGSHLSELATTYGHRDIDTITLADLRRYRADLINRAATYEDHPNKPAEPHGLSIHTIRGKLRAVKTFFTWLLTEGVIPADPSARLTLPNKPRATVPKAIPDDDIKRMRDYALEHNLPRDVAIIHVLAETGARVAGVAHLTRNDIDLTTGQLNVTEKGEKTRPVYLTPAGIAALREWLRVRPPTDHSYIFTARGGHPLTPGGIYKCLKRLAAACGIHRFNPHAFRHAFAREMLNAGLSLETVSDLMGHSSITVTADSYAIWTAHELHEKANGAHLKRGLWTDD